LTKLYLIRHGQSEWNELKKIQGQTNTNLTKHGKDQAKMLAHMLIGENIDVIYTSDLNRAKDTAKTISEKINKPLIYSEFLREIKFGIWEGLTISEVEDRYKDQYLIWNKSPDELILDNAETLQILKDRVMNWINLILLENKEKNIAIVSHGTTLKVLMLSLLGIPLCHYKNFSISNVGLSVIECRDFNNVLTKLNDLSHLKELL
jgi:probable phosphoglycerate mutase